jgi:hypothetical protein
MPGSMMKKTVCVLTIALVFWAYWPALRHIPKQDHVAYLAALAKKSGPVSIIFGQYAFNRAEYSAVVGDEFLFRPLLFIMMGCEQVLFGYHFEAWQLFGICLHLAVVWALGALLWQMAPGFPAILGASFFALLVPNVFMVNWPQIHGYMLFTLCVLLSLGRLYRISREDRLEMRRLFPVIVLMTAAVLLYEGGVGFTLLMMLFLVRVFKGLPGRAAAWGMGVPALLFMVASSVDRWFCHSAQKLSAESHIIFSQVLSIDTVITVVRTFKWLWLGGIFLEAPHIGEDIRSYVSPETWSWVWPLTDIAPRLFGGLLLTGLMIMMVAASRNSHIVRRQKTWSSFLMLLLLAYVAVIVVGRVNPRGYFAGLMVNGYYFYIFWAIMLAAVMSRIDMACFRSLNNGKSLVRLIVVLLTGIILINAVSIRKVNIMIADKQRDQKRLLSFVEGFVRGHQQEPGFSFYIDPGCPGNQPEWLPRGATARYGFSDIYYPVYVTVKEPKYFLPCP